MRSRYSAFVAMDEAYLLATWHPQTRPSRVSLDPDVRWLGLTIKATVDGAADQTRGTVEFVARCKRAGRAQRLHELSRFEGIDGQWFYLDGEHLGNT
jgi:SEC-C motif-containing protein